MHRRTFPLAAALAVVASLLLAAAAGAHSRDRNRDRIPDRWERHHHLSLSVNQARRDQDRDGLKNLAEYRAGTDPRKADTDDDGIGDAQENAGTVASFSNGVLTITLAKGGTLSGTVTSDTEIECGDDSTTARASDDGGDGDHGGSGDDGDHGDRGGAGDDDGDRGDDDNNDDDNCGTDALTAGRQVEEADLKAANGEAVFEKVELGA